MKHRALRSIGRPIATLAAGLACAGLAAQPVCAIQIDNDTTICQGQTVTLHGPPGYSNYLWSTGQTTQNITVGASGAYWCQVSYPTGNFAVNGNFSAGNTGFTSMFNYGLPLTTDGNYWIGTNANTYHNQWLGTGNGPYLLVNAGWMHSGWRFWCQSHPVCPGQTYTIQFRAMSLAAQGNPTLAVFVNNVWTGVDHITSPVQGQWQTFSTTWTAPPGTTTADFCVQVSSGHGIGNDIGFDDVQLSATVVLRDTAVVTVTPLPQVDLGPDATLCDGQTVLLDANNPGGTYLWQDGSTSSTYLVSGPGNYSVVVTANDCSAADAVNIAYNPLPPLDLGPDLTLCDGESVTFDVTVPGASYLWQNGSNSPTFTVTSAGQYSVGVQLNGCSNTDAVNVAYNPLPVVDLGPDLTFCQGQSATLDATTPGATYLWSTGSTSAALTVSLGGTYDVDVMVGGCTSSDAVQVNVTPLPLVDLGPDQTICPGSSITLNAAVPGGSYQWSTGSTAPSITVSAPGTYSVQVTVNGCTASDAMTLNHHALPVFSLGPDQTICAGATATFGASVAGATYLWSTGATASSIQPSTAGIYWLDATTNGCTARDSVQLFVTPLPVVDLGSDYAICPAATTTLNAAQPGATYAWSTGATAPSITVGPGSYSVQVTVNGCAASDAITIGTHPAAQVDLGPDLTLCPGQQPVLNVAQPGASYLWHDGSTASAFTVTATGPISVQLTDANGCVATDALQATYLTPAAIDLGPDATLCAGDALTLDATVPGASYLWSTGATTPTIGVSTAGTYSVAVQQGPCTVTDAISIAVLPAPAVDLGPDQTLCTGESIVLDAAVAGAAYQWSTGAQSAAITVSQGGTYAVTVTSGAGCSATDAITIVEATPGAIDLGPDATLCQGQSLLLNAALPGATYLWSTGATAPTLNVSASGTYWVQATQGSCAVTDTIAVQVQPMPAVELGADQTVCAGTAVTLDAFNPNATYAWSTGATTPAITVAQPGSYSVTVDLNGCTATDAMQLNVVQPVPIDLGPDLTLCLGDQAVFSIAAANAGILWSTGATGASITVSSTGTVWAQVTQGGVCVSSDTVEVVVLDPGSVDLGPDITACEGDAVVLDATLPNGSYLWSTGATTAQLQPTVSGLYGVTVSVAGCSAQDQVQVTFNPLPQVDIGADQSICPGASASFSALTAGASYLWHDGSTGATYATGSAGPVSVTVTVNGCSATDAAQVIALPAPIAALGNDTTLCAGATYTLSAQQAGATYAWSTGSTAPAIAVSAPGTYGVTVNLNGCTASDAVSISYFDPAALDLGPDRLLCPGETATLSTGISGAHAWSTGATGPAITVGSGGLYWVAVQVAACVARDTVSIAYVPLTQPDLGPDRVLCEGDTLALSVTAGAAAVQWSTGSASPAIAVSASGLYTVTLTLQGCTASDAARITFKPWVRALSLGTDSTYCIGAPLVLDASTPGASYAWSTGATAPAIAVATDGLYSVRITGLCIDAADSIRVREGVCDPEVHVPNTFTPNNDGINDVFRVSYLGPNRDFSFDLFDRWGERIVHFASPDDAWDGTVNGQPVPDGVYVWRMRYRATTDRGARAQERMGHLNVLR